MCVLKQGYAAAGRRTRDTEEPAGRAEGADRAAHGRQFLKYEPVSSEL